GWLSGYTVETVPVPEPSTSALLGLAGLALILRRRK
ncbi:MAG: PEP-CTERM sorting domain-containing protein, partial [Verrucomicrobiae bacterium]|nr:PEP-CTERM sorting domain-containing protein [Verrucomicrobiae bacterium]NNJ87625.1 PEP-CTERM sorting domain-containing protein [Akkermansiaceae bacterium]